MHAQVVVISRGRPELVGLALRLFPDPLLCIREDEEENYLRHNPKAKLLKHPASIKGLGKVRQWILDTLPDECVFQVDDDVSGLGCCVGNRWRPIEEPEAIQALIDTTAEVAKGIGTSVFGFAHTVDTRHSRSNSPFTFTGYANGFSLGIIGRKLRFDPTLDTKQDIDYSLQALYRDRVIWRDLRFGFKCSGWFQRPGGNATIRTSETLEKNVRRLKQKWGDAVSIEHSKRNNKLTHQNVSINVQR